MGLFRCPANICEGGMGETPAFGNREDFFQYFQNIWLDGNFPIRMWNVYSMEPAPTTVQKDGSPN